jgi:large subunit ribosomal protein L28
MPAPAHRHGRAVRIDLVGIPAGRYAARSVPGRAHISNLDFLEFAVAAVCDICGKGPGFGNNVSHSHRRTRRRFDPNIQRVRAIVGSTPKRLNVCTGCLKAGKVTR